MKDQELKEILDPTFQDNFKGETLDELEAEKAVLSKLRYKIGFKIGYTQGILNVYPKFFSKITGESFDLAYKLMICKLLEEGTYLYTMSEAIKLSYEKIQEIKNEIYENFLGEDYGPLGACEYIKEQETLGFVALKMLSKGYSVEEICQCTFLSEERVTLIKQEYERSL